MDERHLTLPPEFLRHLATWAEQSRAAVAAIAGTVSAVDWDEVEEMMRRFRALEDLPEDDAKRAIWEALEELTPKQLSLFWRHLPDPLAKKGRPPGTGRVTAAMLDEMDRTAGDRPTRAARAIVGDGAGQKNRADHLVKAWRKKRGKK